MFSLRNTTHITCRAKPSSLQGRSDPLGQGGQGANRISVSMAKIGCHYMTPLMILRIG